MSSLQDLAFRAIFEDSPVGIVVVDQDMKVVDVNDAYCQMLGYTEAEMMKCTISEVTHPEDRQRDREFLPLLLSGEVPRYKAEKRYIAKNGSIVWAEIVVTALLDRSGVSRYVFNMARNITDRRALQGMLPVCTACKKVRDPHGFWNELETYLRTRASAKVEETLCPECVRVSPA
jgi:PAS domain S-box-containing protein